MDKIDHIFIAPKNFEESITFYNNILGWEVAEKWGGGGLPKGAILKSKGRGVGFVLAEQHSAEEDNSWKSGYNSTIPTIHLKTPNLANRFSKIPKGEHVIITPENTHWGTKWFVLKDPDNNLIAFNENL